MDISLSYNGSFAVVVCTKLLPKEEILKDFLEKINIKEPVDWMDEPNDKNAFGILDDVSKEEESRIEKAINELPEKDTGYEVQQAA